MDRNINTLLESNEQRYENVLNAMREMKPFKDEDSIPSLPVVKEDDYRNIVIPNYIRCGAIPKSELVAGKTYIGDCRNASEAVWDGEKFTYMRTKFGFTYPETINHFEDDDGYDLFVPIRMKED